MRSLIFLFGWKDLIDYIPENHLSFANGLDLLLILVQALTFVGFAAALDPVKLNQPILKFLLPWEVDKCRIFVELDWDATVFFGAAEL